jgi:hypothetical protein
MSNLAAKWPVDGHVHFHTIQRVGPTLDAAAASLTAASDERGEANGAVLLAQASSERVFEAIEVASHVAGWSLTPAREEPETLVARRGKVSLAVVCGRQVRAADGLEVLALGTRATFPDGLAFDEAVTRVLRSGALAVVPWGFGKWWGRRARRMEAVLESAGNAELFVGDNGGRAALLGVPRRIRVLQAHGFRVLPGSDPFPFGSDYRRVGRFGFLSESRFDEAAPWRQLRSWLVARFESPTPYGRACGLGRFIFNQAGIQLYNRFRRARPT